MDGALGRLLDAIEAGGDAKSLAARVNETQRQRDTVAAKLEHPSGQQIEAEGFDLELWLTESAKLLAGARNFLETDPEDGRRVLRTALAKGLTVRPDPIEGGWVFEGVGQFYESGLRAVVEGRVTGPTPDPLKLVPPARLERSWSEPPARHSSWQGKVGGSAKWRGFCYSLPSL